MQSALAGFVIVASLGFALPVVAANKTTTLRLWPGDAPGESAPGPEERDTTKPTDNQVAGKPVIRLGNVSQPTILIQRPPKGKETGTAVVIAPGGAYNILAWDLEGTEVCDWLNSIGVTAVLLKYRVPKRNGMPKHAAALQDAQRAVSLVRSRAQEFGIDPARIGVLGFSAGGHLSATVSTTAERTYPGVDDADKVALRPNFAVLVYPAYLTVKDEGDKVAPELHVTNAPPTFIAITADDPVRMENALNYAIALKQAKVPVELHLYPTGGHGYGLRKTKEPVTSWPERAAEWMKTRGWLKAN